MRSKGLKATPAIRASIDTGALRLQVACGDSNGTEALRNRCAKWAGSATAAFDFGAAAILACPVLLWGFNRIPVLLPRVT
jgi:hypothetical protein